MPSINKRARNKSFVYGTVHKLNSNEVAHVSSHILVGFGAGHLLAWFHWIWVLFLLAILASLKEFFVDAYLYDHNIDDQIFDFLQYIIGFIAYIVWIYFVQITDGNIYVNFSF
jgi:hypothetical protein